MRICILAHIFPARSETFIREHVSGLVGRNHQVLVVSRAPDPDMTGPEIDHLKNLGIKVVYVGEFASPKLNWARSLLSVRMRRATHGMTEEARRESRRRLLIAKAEAKAIDQFKPDVIHIHFGDHASHLLALKDPRIDPSICIVTWHGYDFNARHIVESHNDYRALFETAAHHTVGTNFSATKIESLGAPKDRISVIPMGINLSAFCFLSRRYCTNEELRVISVGRLVEVKGHRNLIDAIALLVEQGISVRLTIIGDGPLREDLKAQTQRRGIQNRVSFLGAVPPNVVIEEMHNSHVFALTGIQEPNGKVENQGTVYSEAQATGLPVIGSDLGGVPEALIDGETGILCPPNDIDAIRAAIQSFILQPELISKFGIAGRAFVEEKFAAEKMLDRYEQLYFSRAGTTLPLRA